MSTASSVASPPIMDRLRAETRAQHEATESIPFSSAMMNGTLPRDRYIGQLAAYAVVHRALEVGLRRASSPAVQAVWREDLAKLPLLDADLCHFGVDAGDANQDAMEAAHNFAAELAQAAENDPISLLGYLYVLEGSTLGATILRTHIATAYQLDDAGLAYYSPYGNAVMPHWREFKQRMNDAVTDPAEQDRVVEAARRAFDRIGTVLTALSAGLPQG